MTTIFALNSGFGRCRGTSKGPFILTKGESEKDQRTILISLLLLLSELVSTLYQGGYDELTNPLQITLQLKVWFGCPTGRMVRDSYCQHWVIYYKLQLLRIIFHLFWYHWSGFPSRHDVVLFSSGFVLLRVFLPGSYYCCYYHHPRCRKLNDLE